MPGRSKPSPIPPAKILRRVAVYGTDADRRRAFDVLLRKHGSAADLERRMAR